MQVIFTSQAWEGWAECVEFMLLQGISIEKIEEVENDIIVQSLELGEYPFRGQKEVFLDWLKMGHRRLVVGHYKIIYRVDGERVYITDIFDSRQNPRKMKP